MLLRSLPHPAWTTALLVMAGALAAPALPASPRTLPSLCAVILLLLLLLAFAGRPGGGREALAVGLCLLAGAGKLLLDRERMPALPGASTGSATTVVGVIDDEPVRRSSRLVLLLDAAAAGEPVPLPWHARVQVLLPPERAQTGFPCVAYGMTIALRGTLERPPAERNPGEFDPRRSFEANGITYTLRVPSWSGLRVLSFDGGSWVMRTFVIPSRRAIRSLIDSSVGGEEGELLKGLIIGERSGLSLETREAFVNAGVAHILAVSGSNVAVVAAVLFLILQTVRVPRTLGTWCAMTGILFYMLLTGSQPPVVRATIMAVVLLTGKLLRRRTNALNSLGVAALLLVAIDARQVYDIGFQLSFASVASIIILYPSLSAPLASVPWRGRAGRAAAALLRVSAVSLAAALGTLPLTAASFGRVSAVGVLVNLAVIPAAELSVMLGAAGLGGGLLSPALAEAYGALNRVILHWILGLTHLAGFSSVAYIDTARFRTPEAAVYLLVLAALFRRTSRLIPRLVIAALLCALYGMMAPALNGPGREGDRLRVSVIDVGQGDAILAEFPDGTNVLVDAGPRTTAMDAGTRIVVPFLKRRGISTIDLLVVSHMHADHAGGVPGLVAGVDVKQLLVLSPQALRDGLGPFLSPEAAFRCDSAGPGTALLRSTCARIYLLSPVPGCPLGHDPSGNASLVLKLQYGEVAFLLTGDAAGDQEQELVRTFDTFLRSTVLKVAHHGSNNSTCLPFLHAVRPRLAVISVGRFNSFRHPSPATLARLASCGVEVSRTDHEGAVIFETDGASVHKLEWR